MTTDLVPRIVFSEIAAVASRGIVTPPPTESVTRTRSPSSFTLETVPTFKPAMRTSLPGDRPAASANSAVTV